MLSSPASQQARYVVRLYSPLTGDLIAIFDDFRFLQVERYLNSYDIVTLAIDGNDPRVTLFTLDAILEVWRRPDRVPQAWYRECTTLHRSPQNQVTEDHHAIFTSYSRGLVDLLRRRQIGYYANTAYTLKSGPGEQVIKEFAEENAGPGANSIDRRADGTTLGLTIEASAGLGDLWSGARSWQNLLDVIQEVSLLTHVDFKIERVGFSGRSFLFSTGYPQLGIDRSATIIFGLSLGNMLAPSYTLSRTEEITRVIVLGQGADVSRQVVVRESADVTDSPWNVIETSADARNQSTLDGLNAVGDVQLQKSKKQESFVFNVLQVTGVQYGVDYFVGDIVGAGFLSVNTTKKITAAKMNVSEGRETITIEFSDTPPVIA